MVPIRRTPGPIFLWLSQEDWFSVRGRQPDPAQVEGSIRFFIEFFRHRVALKTAVNMFLAEHPGQVHEVIEGSGVVPPIFTVSVDLPAGEDKARAFIRLGHELFSQLRSCVLRELGL